MLFRKMMDREVASAHQYLVISVCPPDYSLGYWRFSWFLSSPQAPFCCLLICEFSLFPFLSFWRFNYHLKTDITLSISVDAGVSGGPWRDTRIPLVKLFMCSEEDLDTDYTHSCCHSSLNTDIILHNPILSAFHARSFPINSNIRRRKQPQFC